MLNFEQLYEMYGPVYAGPGASKEQKIIRPRKLKAHHVEAISKAKKYAMEQSIRSALLKQTKEQETQRMLQVKLNQAMLLLSRVYIGSINYDVNDAQIRQAFRSFGTIKSVSLSFDPMTQKHMGYCFLEFDFPEAAQLLLAQQGTGLSICGRQCKLGRPANMPQTGPLVDDLYSEAYKLARIYVTNIRFDIPCQDIKSVFEAFGEVISCIVQPDLSQPGGVHLGFAFIEYRNIQSALEAITAMNHFDLGGQLLYVSRAITPPHMVLPAATGSSVITGGQMPAASAVAAASITAQVQALEVEKTVIKGDDSTDLSRRKARQKFSETKIATDKVAAPTLVIPDKLKEESTEPPTVVIAIPKQEQESNLALKSESLLPLFHSNHHQQSHQQQQQIQQPEMSGSTIFDQIDQMKHRGEEIRNQILPIHKTEPVVSGRVNCETSCVMLLQNLVGRDQLDEYIEEEVEEECSKFGAVAKVKIFITNLNEEGSIGDPEAPFRDEVRVFVEFKSAESLTEAVYRMNGRFFGGRIVQASKYNQDMYEAAEYMG